MNDPGDDGVTNAELYRLIVRLDTKIDKLASDHENRIRRVEQAIYVAVGFGLAGTGSGVAGLFAALN